MWLRALKWAAQAAVASGLAEKAKQAALGWIVRKFNQAAEKKIAYTNAQSAAINEAALKAGLNPEAGVIEAEE